MKKILTLATAFFVLASCAKESGGNGGDGPEGGNPISGKTYATFNFSFGDASKGRALADYDPSNGDTETDDAKFTADDLRLVIFNADNGVLEFNEAIDAASKTIELTAGKKKIFVFANTSKLADNDADPTNQNFDKRIAALVPGDPASTLTQFYALKFSAGVPQQITTTDRATDARTFDISNLHTIVEAAKRGLPMSNTAELDYTLVADVTEAAASGGTPSESGSSPVNCFKIKIHYMIAKGKVVMGPTALKDGTGSDKVIITNPKYGIKNLPVYSSYVQQWAAGAPNGYYHNTTFANDAAFDTVFDGAMNVNVPSSTTAASCQYIYMPENTSSNYLRGQTTYFAINATYKPGFVVYDMGRDAEGELVLLYDTLDGIGQTGSNTHAGDYIYLVAEILDIPAKTFFKTPELLGKALWLNDNPGVDWDGTQPQQDAAAALLATAEYLEFKEAQSWYRLDIGDGTMPNIELGVLRGHRYTATIYTISGPGVPNEGDLDDGKTDPVFSNTFIHAEIEAAGWTDVNTGGNL